MDTRHDAGRLEEGTPRGVDALASAALARLARRDPAEPVAVVRADLVARLTDTVISADGQWAVTLFADLRRAGVTRTAFADLYLPEIARRLGKAWEDDTLGFAAVTVGMARLQAVLREIGRDWTADHDAEPVAGGATVLLIIPDNEQHTLGGLVLLGLLRRRGISVALRIAPDREDLAQLLQTRSFDAAMISVGQESSLETCRKLVIALRDLTARKMRIAVGGAVLGLTDRVAEQTGADVVSNDIAGVLAALGLDRPAQDALGAVRPRVTA